MLSFLQKFKGISVLLSLDKANSLKELRIQFLAAAFFVMLAACAIFLPVRLILGDYARLLIMSIAACVSVVGLLLLRYKKIALAQLLLSIFFYALFTILFYAEWTSLHYYIVILSFYGSCLPFIIKSKKQLWVEYAIIAVLIFNCLSYRGLEWFDMLVSIGAFCLFMYLIYILIRTIEDKLQNQIAQSNELNQSLIQKNKESQLYTNIMAHDIKAPLRSVKGFNQLIDLKLKQLGCEDESIHSHFSYIYKSIDMLEQLIEDLLLQSRVQQDELKYEEVDLNELVESQLFKLKFQIEQSNTEVRLENLGHIYVDQKSMVILINNLISNAVKYQPKDTAHTPKITISQHTLEGETIITVSDNGVGLKDINVDEIFSPFKRFHSAKEYEGTGLGLSICKSIVERHQGSIHLDTNGDQGCTFTIKLPAYVDA